MLINCSVHLSRTWLHLLKSPIHPLDYRIGLRSKDRGTCFLDFKGLHEQFENLKLKTPASVGVHAIRTSEAANPMLEQGIGCGGRCSIREQYSFMPFREMVTNYIMC